MSRSKSKKHKKDSRSKHKRKHKHESDSSSSSDSDSSSDSSVELLEKLKAERLKALEEKKRQKELMKMNETPEEKR